MEVKPGLKLQSTAFKEGGRIPDKYTCNGDDISPALNWGKAEAGVNSWALIVEDPDAPRGVFTHWIIYNIPANVTSLSEGLPTREKLDNGALQGKNDALKVGYSGPCPPPGPVHHYHFNLYALDALLDLPSGASKQQVMNSMRVHIKAQEKMIADYQSLRSPK